MEVYIKLGCWLDKVYNILIIEYLMRPIKSLQLGKNGLTDEFVGQVRRIFETEKMLKVSILKSYCRDKDEASQIGQGLVGKLGRRFGFKLIGYVLTITKYRREQGKA